MNTEKQVSLVWSIFKLYAKKLNNPLEKKKYRLNSSQLAEMLNFQQSNKDLKTTQIKKVK